MCKQLEIYKLRAGIYCLASSNSLSYDRTYFRLPKGTREECLIRSSFKAFLLARGEFTEGKRIKYLIKIRKALPDSFRVSFFYKKKSFTIIMNGDYLEVVNPLDVICFKGKY